MNRKQSNITCIACSIFREELKTLGERGEPDLPIHIQYLDSMLHMEPSKLHHLLDSHLQKEQGQGKQVLILFGECHAYLHEQESLPGVERVRGINCPEILLGRSQYRSLRKQGAFFLMYEWTLRWQEVFQSQMGFEKKVAKDFFPEMHTKLLYLDTGLVPVPTGHLEAISEYTGLPWEVMSVDTAHLVAAIREAVERMKKDEGK